MAEYTPDPESTSNRTPSHSYFVPTVSLYDWWLVKSQGNSLSISGISSKKGEAVRVFNSAPIAKRDDEFSLETADGVIVLIKGFINEERTLDHGFTPQVFKRFLFSFPENWKSYALECFRAEAEPDSDPVNAVMDNVFRGEAEPNTDPVNDVMDEEKSIPVTFVSPEEAPENNKSFPGNECEVSKEMMSGVDVACGSGGNRRSTRLRNIKASQQQKKKKQKQQSTFRGPLKHPHEEPSCTCKAVENRDLDNTLDNVSANVPETSSNVVENSFPASLVTLEKAMGHCNNLYLEGEEDKSIKTSEVNGVHGSGWNRRSSRLLNVKVNQKKQPASGDSLKHPEKEQSSTLKAVHNCDLDTAAPDNLSANLPEKSSDAMEKSFPTSLVSPDKTTGDCSKSFLEDEQDMPIKTSEVNVHGSGWNRRSGRLLNVKDNQKKQPASGDPLKHPKKKQSSTFMAVQNCDLDTPAPDNVSANFPEKSSDATEKSFPTLVLPDKTMGDCSKSFLEDEQDMPIKTSEVNVHGSGWNRRSGRLLNVKDNQKKQPASGDPLKHPKKKQSSTFMAVQNCDLDTPAPDNVSANLPEKSSDATEKSFPTLVLPDKTTGYCIKSFLEDEQDMSIKASEVNIVHGSGWKRPSARVHNVKPFQKKQPATGKSDEGLENPSTPVQSQSGIVNTLSGQVTNKFRSKISKKISSKTEGGYKKKRATVEAEAVNPKRKVMKPSSYVKSPQGRDVSHLNEGSEQGFSVVSPESLSLKKSRSGRLLLPSMEFWRNQIPIYNADHEVKEIQEGLTLTSPFRGFSPSTCRL